MKQTIDGAKIKRFLMLNLTNGVDGTNNQCGKSKQFTYPNLNLSDGANGSNESVEYMEQTNV